MDNAGAVSVITEIDPRSLDIVVATTTEVYVLPSAIYDPTAPTNGITSLKAATWRKAHTFATVTPRTVTRTATTTRMTMRTTTMLQTPRSSASGCT